MQAAGMPPAIKETKALGMNKGLVDCLADIPKGCYADVIVQFVCSKQSEKTPGMPCLLVWDGSEWPHKDIPLWSVEYEDRAEMHRSDPALKQRATGRMVTIFSYDFDKHCKRPIESGDWLFLENLHCAYPPNAPSARSSLVMHNNIRHREIYRLDLPMTEGLFYTEKWKTTMKRVKDALPLPAAVIEAQRRQAQLLQPGAALVAAPAANASISPQRTPSLAALDRLHTMILDEMLKEGVRMPSSDDALARVAKSVVATMKTAAAPAAPAAQPAVAPPAAAPAVAGPNRAAPTVVRAAAVVPKQEAPAAPPRAAAAAPTVTSPKRAAEHKFAVPALPAPRTVPNRQPPKNASLTPANPAQAVAVAKPTALKTAADAAPAAPPTVVPRAAAAPTATSPKGAAPKAAEDAALAPPPTVVPRAAAAPAATSPKRAAPKSAADAALAPPPTVVLRAAAAPAAAPAATSPKRAAAPKAAAPAAVSPRASKIALPPAVSTAASSSRRQLQQHCPNSQTDETDAAPTAVAGATTRAAAASATTNDAAGQSPTRKSTRKRSAPITHPEEERRAAPPKRSPRTRKNSLNSTIVIDDSDDEEEEEPAKKPQVGGKKAGDGRPTVSWKSASPEKKSVPRKFRAGTPPPRAKNFSRLRSKAEMKKE